MRETESCLNRLERAAVCERCAVRKKLRGRSVPNRIPSDLFSCSRAIDSHVTAAVACGISICYTVVPRRARCVGFADDREAAGAPHGERSPGGLIPPLAARCSRLSWSWGPRSRVCRTVGLWPCAIIWRARARARGVRTSRCLIRSIGPVAVGPPQALGRTCALPAPADPVVGTCESDYAAVSDLRGGRDAINPSDSYLYHHGKIHRRASFRSARHTVIDLS